jgi:hypothetical protein
MGDHEELGAARWALRRIVNYFGETPKAMLEQSQKVEEFIEKDPKIAKLRSNPVLRGSPYHLCLEQLLWRYLSGVPGKEIATLSDFFRSILQIDPAERFTLSEILQHRWVQTHGSGTT